MELKDRPTPQVWTLDSRSGSGSGSGSGLPYSSLVNSVSSLELSSEQRAVVSPRRAQAAVAVLCVINLLNYMERYTIAGVLPNIQKYFGLTDSTAGLLQTVFIFSLLLLAPVFGYLGDRYNRKYIMIGGLSVWLVTSAGSSFVTESYFWLLMLLRAMVGVGEASYSTIAPTIIGDLFVGGQRSVFICVFYVFIPVGSGLGYIAGSGVAALAGDWHWALRVTPILGVLGLLLLVFLCPNPPRGAAETRGQGVTGDSSYLQDVLYLLRNKSFVWSSLGVTATTFVAGGLAFWMPTFLSRARVSQGIQPPCVKEPCTPTDSYIFGAVTVLTGVLGSCLGTFLSWMFVDKLSNIDPIICGAGLLGAGPCLFISILVAAVSVPACYVFIFLSELLIGLNWAVMADILLYVVVPTRRSTAEALQISLCHLLGDAVSPLILGAISDAVRRSDPDSPAWSFHSLKSSLLLCPALGVLGGLFFLLTSLYISEDRRTAQQAVQAGPPPQHRPSEPIETSGFE